MPKLCIPGTFPTTTAKALRLETLERLAEFHTNLGTCMEQTKNIRTEALKTKVIIETAPTEKNLQPINSQVITYSEKKKKNHPNKGF